MGIKKEQTLPPEDIALFRAAVADTKPLKPLNRAEHKKLPPLVQARQSLADKNDALQESPRGRIGLQDRLEDEDEPSYLRPGMANRTLRDLRRGRWVTEDEIDLHGLTRDQARYLFSAFIAQALQEDIRCIRIVHGKGLGSPGKQAVLRQLVRGWLMQMDEVLAYCQARPQDGGEGAVVALLRSAQKIRPSS